MTSQILGFFAVHAMSCDLEFTFQNIPKKGDPGLRSLEKQKQLLNGQETLGFL